MLESIVEVHAPILYLIWPPGPVTDDLVKDTYRRVTGGINEIIDKHGHWAGVVGTLGEQDDVQLNAKQRKFVADYFESEEARLTKCHCVGVASGSKLMRGIVTAIDWVKPPPFERKVFKTIAETENWVAATFSQKSGKAVRPGGRSFPLPAKSA